MAYPVYLLNGVTDIMTDLNWPLMNNNISRSDLDALIKYLEQDDPKLTHGPLVKRFEQEWSHWVGLKYSVMVNSGSSANDLTMMALREFRGTGEVIVPPLTWVSDVSSVLRAGLTPVFADINPQTLAMDTDSIFKAITPQTKAVFLTHVLGFDGLTDSLLDFLKDSNILLIEDVCESHGATHNEKKVGSFGWASNFSFYYAHHMTTIEGGIISTDDEELYDMLRMMRSHGMVRESINERTKDRYKADFPELNPDFIFAYPSHNMRTTELNGLLGLEQLKRLDSNNVLRTRNFLRFLEVLNPSLFQTDFKTEGSSNYALTLVLKEKNFEMRDKVENLLRNLNVEFRRGLSGGGNQLRQPYLQNLLGIPEPESMINTEHVHHFGWYIGNFPELNLEKIDSLGRELNSI